jgi:hypothetical protein
MKIVQHAHEGGDKRARWKQQVRKNVTKEGRKEQTNTFGRNCGGAVGRESQVEMVGCEKTHEEEEEEEEKNRHKMNAVALSRYNCSIFKLKTRP